VLAGEEDDDVIEAALLDTLLETLAMTAVADASREDKTEEADTRAPLSRVEVSAGAALDAQATAEGRSVTAAMLQIFLAYETAEAWSAASHFPARQQAIELKKVGFLQIQAMSILEHPPICDPLVYCRTQD